MVGAAFDIRSLRRKRDKQIEDATSPDAVHQPFTIVLLVRLMPHISCILNPFLLTLLVGGSIHTGSLPVEKLIIRNAYAGLNSAVGLRLSRTAMTGMVPLLYNV